MGSPIPICSLANHNSKRRHCCIIRLLRLDPLCCLNMPSGPPSPPPPHLSSPIPIPIFLLKTSSTPHDAYGDYFSSPWLNTQTFVPRFIPVLEHCFLEPALQRVTSLLLCGALQSSRDCDDGRAGPVSSVSTSQPPSSSKKRDVEERYGGMIFTSQRAVEAFLSCLSSAAATASSPPSSSRSSLPILPDSLPLYVVGPATRRALCSSPHVRPENVLGAHTGNGERLAAYILEHYPTVSQKRDGSALPLLFLVGKERRAVIPDTLRKEGVDVREEVVYEASTREGLEEEFERVLDDVVGHHDEALLSTAPPSSSSSAATRQDEQHPRVRICWVVLFAPTGARELVRALSASGRLSSVHQRPGDGKGKSESCQRRIYLAAIGPTTRDFLRQECGIDPHVCAEKPSPEGVGEGIKTFMQRPSLDAKTGDGRRDGEGKG